MTGMEQKHTGCTGRVGQTAQVWLLGPFDSLQNCSRWRLALTSATRLPGTARSALWWQKAGTARCAPAPVACCLMCDHFATPNAEAAALVCKRRCRSWACSISWVVVLRHGSMQAWC
jgi:hypothetical protein